MALMEIPRTFQKEPRFHEDVEIKTVSRANSWEIVQAAQLYFKSWNQYGLCQTPEEAFRKVANFDPESAFLLVDKSNPQKGVIAAINTIPVFEPEGMRGILKNLDTYKKVENASLLHQKAANPNYVLCFSVTADLDSIPKVRRGNKYISPSRYLIEGIPTPVNVRKIAYSKVLGPVDEKKTLFDFYWDSLDKTDTSPLGPIGMHEHYGGLVAAVFNQSRTEDIFGGKGNILVLYPRTPEEKVHFDMIKDNRKKIKNGKLNNMPYEKIGTNVLFTDY